MCIRDRFKAFGARFLVRAGRFENPEGSSRTRNVVIEFPSYQAALDCWQSPEYQAALQLRLAASSIDLVIIEAVSYTHLDVYKRQAATSVLRPVASIRAPQRASAAMQRAEAAACNDYPGFAFSLCMPPALSLIHI